MASTSTSDSSDLEQKRICRDCIGEQYLRRLIDDQGVVATCAYCDDEDAKTFIIEEIAGRVDKAFEDHYERTPQYAEGLEAAMHNDPESDYCWERSGQKTIYAIADAIKADEDVAEDVMQILQERYGSREADEMGQETPFSSEAYYCEKAVGYSDFYSKWNQFENGIKSTTRFFSRAAHAVLDEIFADLPALRTATQRPVVVTIGNGTEVTHLFRARVFAAEYEKLESALAEPWLWMGSPPMAAAKAGRMNANGISVFYGAVEEETAIAEVRPPVGSDVAVARFELTRPLQVLDLDALKSIKAIGSIFNPSYLKKAQQAKFMEILSHKMTRPVMPNDEAFDYLPTQAVADYLASEHKLDGMVFPSIQQGGASRNVVLFHHAAKVETEHLPKGTTIDTRLESCDEDGPYPDYAVIEWTPTNVVDTAKETTSHGLILRRARASDSRLISLRCMFAEMKVHSIKSVNYVVSSNPVSRHRITK